MGDYLSQLKDFYATHKRVALLFSGGKDSVAMMHMTKPWWDKTVFVWVNTGASCKEITAYMAEVRKKVPRFVEIVSNQPKFIATHGFPSDVVPMRYTTEGFYYDSTPRPVNALVCSKYDCCKANIWTPIWEFMQTGDFDGMLKGQKLADHEQASWDDHCVVNGRRIDIAYPLKGWSDDGVRSYIKDCGELMYERYKLKHSSLDCWSCTAYWEQLDDRAQYMRTRHPDQWAMVESVVKDIRVAIKDQTKHLGGLDG